MTILRRRMIEDMQLRGLAEKTQDSYLRAVRQLAEYYDKSPDQISEEELRQYFLYLSVTVVQSDAIRWKTASDDKIFIRKVENNHILAV